MRSPVAAPADESARPDAESRLRRDHHVALRLWLRMFACTTMVERRIRARLRERFAITLARFDLMAQLERYADGLRMSELSERLMVTGGNVTSLVNQLVLERLVERVAVASDRRVQVVRLTAQGRRLFATMAAEHERWIVELLGDLPAADRRRLHALLGSLKGLLRTRGA